MYLKFERQKKVKKWYEKPKQNLKSQVIYKHIYLYNRKQCGNIYLKGKLKDKKIRWRSTNEPQKKLKHSKVMEYVILKETIYILKTSHTKKELKL